MKITVKKLTDEKLMQRACQFTINKETDISLKKIYQCEHSPVRTQMFWVEMFDIPSFVSTHLVRHKIGVEHFVKSNRDDRGGTGHEDRNTPVNHAMFINAEALISMARKRLCRKAHKKTVEVMEAIRQAVGEEDLDLYKRMVKNCIYRGGCYELVSCGSPKHEEAI